MPFTLQLLSLLSLWKHYIYSWSSTSASSTNQKSSIFASLLNIYKSSPNHYSLTIQLVVYTYIILGITSNPEMTFKVHEKKPAMKIQCHIRDLIPWIWGIPGAIPHGIQRDGCTHCHLSSHKTSVVFWAQMKDKYHLKNNSVHYLDFWK